MALKFVLAIGPRIPQPSCAYAYQKGLIFDHAACFEDACILARFRPYDVLVVEGGNWVEKELSRIVSARSKPVRVVSFHHPSSKWNPTTSASVVAQSAEAMVDKLALVLADEPQRKVNRAVV